MILYRYVDSWRFNDFGFELTEYFVVKETPCGYWFVPMRASHLHAEIQKKYRRWVSKDAEKRYCYPTKELAWNSYKIRKRWQVRRLKGQLERAECVLDRVAGMDAPAEEKFVMCYRIPGVSLLDF